ncbi:antichymotrypsin-2-like isoform X5 [Ostrinia nubilalis]|uniref:antichymotrypsin-2-like isoform X5 n=1 Tax=Ostrinia nubilalis TaxID=29057 RepID=UPI0030824A38
MLKSPFVLFVASAVLFSSTFAGSIETYEESNSSSASSSGSSSYSSTETKDGKTSSNSNSSAYADASANSSYKSGTKVKCCKNERYVKCPTILCVPNTCDQLGKPISCPRIDPNRCPDKPACVCVEGYVRDCNGVCIPKKQCPSCGGDPNAEAGCGLLCGPKCSGNRPVPEDCPCLLNGCVCKPGFLYDDKQGKCVKEGQCSPCQQNEVYTTCANGGCGKWNCTQYYEPDLCIDPLECIPGCVCRDKYLRGPDGTCIPQDDCPAALCPNPNEIYDSCPLACPPRQCGIDDRAVLCAAGQPCLPPGCRCQDGFVRNDKGVCVTREECPPEPGTYTCDDSVEQLLSDGNNAFTGIFMHESMQTYPNQSCIMSAFSVFVPLGEFMMYSGGNTRNQLKKILNLRSDDDVRCVFPRLTKRLQAEQNVILNMASRTFPSDVYPLSDGFVEETREIFGAGVEPLNFNQPQAAADRINAWVANETNDRIKDIATPNMFNRDTRLVIANAIYFLGNWVKQFNPNNTKDRDFHVNNQKTVKIPTMYQESSFSYGENDTLDCKMLKMDYKGGNFSFLIYLPNDVEGLPALIEKLKQPGVFSDSYQAMFYAKVQVHLPKIKTESEFDLADILKSAGVTDLFDASKSNLTGILKVDDPLFVSAAKQKAFCLVDETGTEAAAANIFVGATTTSVGGPIPKVYVFDAKHPFAFYVMYERRIPIFSGYFVNAPESS